MQSEKSTHHVGANRKLSLFLAKGAKLQFSLEKSHFHSMGIYITRELAL